VSSNHFEPDLYIKMMNFILIAKYYKRSPSTVIIGVHDLLTPDPVTSRYKFFPNRRGGVSGFGQAPASRRRPDDDNQGAHRWGGGGQRLGD